MYLGKPKHSPYQDRPGISLQIGPKTRILIAQFKSQEESHIHNTDTKELTPSLLIMHGVIDKLESTHHQAPGKGIFTWLTAWWELSMGVNFMKIHTLKSQSHLGATLIHCLLQDFNEERQRKGIEESQTISTLLCGHIKGITLFHNEQLFFHYNYQ